MNDPRSTALELVLFDFAPDAGLLAWRWGARLILNAVDAYNAEPEPDRGGRPRSDTTGFQPHDGQYRKLLLEWSEMPLAEAWISGPPKQWWNGLLRRAALEYGTSSPTRAQIHAAAAILYQETTRKHSASRKSALAIHLAYTVLRVARDLSGQPLVLKTQGTDKTLSDPPLGFLRGVKAAIGAPWMLGDKATIWPAEFRHADKQLRATADEDRPA